MINTLYLKNLHPINLKNSFVSNKRLQLLVIVTATVSTIIYLLKKFKEPIIDYIFIKSMNLIVKVSERFGNKEFGITPKTILKKFIKMEKQEEPVLSTISDRVVKSEKLVEKIDITSPLRKDLVDIQKKHEKVSVNVDKVNLLLDKFQYSENQFLMACKDSNCEEIFKNKQEEESYMNAKKEKVNTIARCSKAVNQQLLAFEKRVSDVILQSEEEKDFEVQNVLFHIKKDVKRLIIVMKEFDIMVSVYNEIDALRNKDKKKNFGKVFKVAFEKFEEYSEVVENDAAREFFAKLKQNIKS